MAHFNIFCKTKIRRFACVYIEQLRSINTSFGVKLNGIAEMFLEISISFAKKPRAKSFLVVILESRERFIILFRLDISSSALVTRRTRIREKYNCFFSDSARNYLRSFVSFYGRPTEFSPNFL